MKNVFTNRELPHIWAHQSQESGRAHNMFFDRGTIYSYGWHFPMARHVVDKFGGKCVLFTTEDYSNTTARHKSITRRAIPAGVPVFHTGDVTAAPSEAMLQGMVDVIRARVSGIRTSKSKWGLNDIPTLVNNARMFKAAFKLRGGVYDPDLSDQIELRRKWETGQAVRDEKREAKNKETLAKWLSLPELPFEPKPGYAYMRVGCALNAEVETTLGARVPLEHVQKVAPLVLLLLKEGRTYKKNGHTIHLGNYTLDEITAEGDVIAGCHRFDRAEIERFAKVIGVQA